MQIAFFKGIPLERESIALTLTPEGRPKGEAYVEFPSDEAQKEALGRHKGAMGERYIELFLSTKANMVQVGRSLTCCPRLALPLLLRATLSTGCFQHDGFLCKKGSERLSSPSA